MIKQLLPVGIDTGSCTSTKISPEQFLTCITGTSQEFRRPRTSNQSSKGRWKQEKSWTNPRCSPNVSFLGIHTVFPDFRAVSSPFLHLPIPSLPLPQHPSLANPTSSLLLSPEETCSLRVLFTFHFLGLLVMCLISPHPSNKIH